MTNLSRTAVTSTTLSMAVTNLDAGATGIEVQVGTDFDRGIAPILRFPVTGQIDLAGLNHGTRYSIRARAMLPGYVSGSWSPVLAAYTPLAAARQFATRPLAVSPALIVVPEAVAWSCNSAEDGHPASLLALDAPNVALWARKAQGGYEIIGEHSGAPVDTIGLLASNASEAMQVTVTAGPTIESTRGNSSAFKMGPQPFRASAGLDQRDRGFHALLRLPAAQSYPFWRIRLYGDLPGDLLVMTHAVIGLARVTKNLSADSSEAWNDASSLQRDRAGAPSRVAGYRSRSVDFDLSLLKIEQFEAQYRDLRDRIGLTTPVLVVPNSNPDEGLHDRILYGTIAESRTALPYSRRFNQSFSIDSII